MDQGPVVIDEIYAGSRFLAEFQEYIPIKTAFWLKESDEMQRYLYVASDEITDDNFDIAYGEVIRIASKLDDPLFDPFKVKLVGGHHPLAKEASNIRKYYRPESAVRLRDKVFGGSLAEEVYIYPENTVKIAT
ncbi:MAG: hypothetical protein EBV06_13620 [Planctomycetia bacterium]|nr:hypothetical protein [Planctomycetia bacterium]